jgi:UDP-glucuronate decarboxylase
MANSSLVGPINLGNPKEYSMLETAQLIIGKINSTSSIVFRDLPSDDPRMRCPDISLARSALSWIPSIDIDEGLDRLIDWYQNQGDVR